MFYQPKNYAVLKSQLETFGLEMVAKENNPKNLVRSHRQIQKFFQSEILDRQSKIHPEIQNISSATEELVMSYYVELNKQLRLLGADLGMLQVSRNPETIAQRQQQASDRLKLLITYCDTLLNLKL